MENKIGIIYIFSNPAMPGLIKIGFTEQQDVKQRLLQLYNTSVPFPFECVYAARVNNMQAVEDALHIAFAPDRVNAKREFFATDASRAIAIIKLLQIEDVTPKVLQDSNTENLADAEAGEAYAIKRRPRFSFIEMKIPFGSELICRVNEETVTVASDRTVIFRGEETSLTNATRVILNNSYHVAPNPYWQFNGKLLKDIYDETYTFN